MIQLQILSGKKAGTAWSSRRFPFWVGRSSDAEFQSEEPGVWDKHFQISLEQQTFHLRCSENAFVTLNGVKSEEASLKNGDLIEAGALKIRFNLAPALQKNFIVREGLTWIALTLMCLAQIALIYWLIG